MTIEIETGTTDTDKPSILWDNIFERGTVTVVNEVADGAAANAYLEDTTFDFWNQAVGTANITVDMGSEVTCDCFGVAAHLAGSLGITLIVSSSADNVVYTTRSSVVPSDDTTVMGFFPPVSARYWRFTRFGGVCPIGVIKLGKRLIIPTGVLSGHVAINHAQEIELMNNTSIKGQFLGNRIIKMGAETSINFGLLDTEFVDDDMAGFETHYNEGRTFFYAGSPSKFPKDVGYCWRPERAGTMRPSYQEGATLMQVQLDVSVYVE